MDETRPASLPASCRSTIDWIVEELEMIPEPTAIDKAAVNALLKAEVEELYKTRTAQGRAERLLGL